jgi:hypothetical protein
MKKLNAKSRAYAAIAMECNMLKIGTLTGRERILKEKPR